MPRESAQGIPAGDPSRGVPQGFPHGIPQGLPARDPPAGSLKGIPRGDPLKDPSGGGALGESPWGIPPGEIPLGDPPQVVTLEDPSGGPPGGSPEKCIKMGGGHPALNVLGLAATPAPERMNRTMNIQLVPCYHYTLQSGMLTQPFPCCDLAMDRTVGHFDLHRCL